MASQPIDSSLHTPPPELAVEPALEHRLDQYTQRIERRARAEQDEKDREHLIALRDLTDLTVSHGRDGDHRLVHGIEQIESERHVAACPRRENESKHSDSGPEPPPGIPGDTLERPSSGYELHGPRG